MYTGTHVKFILYYSKLKYLAIHLLVVHHGHSDGKIVKIPKDIYDLTVVFQTMCDSLEKELFWH